MAQDEKPLIIAICEVKSKVGELKMLHEYEFDDYKLVGQVNMDTNKGRGLVILSHISIKHLVAEVKPPVEFDEACIVEIQLSGKDLLAFACIYRSPSKAESPDENNGKLNELIKSISLDDKYTHRCFVGDFNLPTINWENWTTPHLEDSKEELFLNALRDSFLHQHVSEPTRCRGTDDPSCVDLILTGEENQASNLEYLNPLGKSDHSSLAFSFKCYVTTKTPQTRYTYNNADYESMKNHLTAKNWREDFKNSSNNKPAEELWQHFKKEVLNLRNKYVPLKEVGNQFWKRKGKIPIGKDLQNEIKQKRSLHRNWVRSSPANRDHHRAKYIVARNRVNRMMTQANRAYEKSICDRSKEKPKLFWSHVRSKMKSSCGVAPLLENPDDKSSLKHDDHEKAEILQRQFCSVFTHEPDGDIPEFPSRTENRVSDLILSEDMVREKIKQLDLNKSYGPDEMHPRMLIELVDHFAEPLAIIMNKTLSEGVLPADWKLAFVTPIYKNKGAQNLAINYRPVSLTSVVCKLMESFMRQHIMRHLKDEKVLTTKQYGFISNRSTVTQLLNYLDKCCESIADGKVVDSIYFDFAKAFDTVPHRRLLKKLEGYGISGTTLGWIKSFLNDRKQLVKVDQAKSKIDSVVSGIPQGSVLGPLLFVIYINDLPDNVLSSILLFADDTKIFKEVNSLNDSLVIQRDIDELVRWSKDWLLKFHPDKCHVLTLGKLTNIVHAHPYTLDGDQLEHVFIEKDLGVLIDSDLSFEEHISRQVKKANSILGVIRRGFEDLNPKIFCILYTTFVRPHLEYAQSVWSPKLRKLVNLIEGVQKRATRLVRTLHGMTYEQRLRKLELPSLEFRRHFGDMVQIYKHLHFYDKGTVVDKFSYRKRPNRKHEFELLPNFADDGVRGVQSKSFYYRCVPSWNNLPKGVVNATSIKAFKEALAKAWKNHPLRYDPRPL